jgi:hypothetical protein
LVEIGNACTSEFGYAYIRHDSSSYEKFIVDGRKTRTGIASATAISVSTPIELCGYLLKEDGGKFQLEDASGYIKLNESTIGTSSFINSQYDAVIQNGNDLYNNIVVNSIPKTIGTAEEVLYSYPGGIPFPAHWVGTTMVGTLPFEYEFKDLLGSENTIGLSIVNPIGTTDYLVYQNSAGTGYIGYTPYVTAVTTNYTNRAVGSLLFYYTGAGGSDATYYVFRFQIRGTALKIYSSISSEFPGTVSEQVFGKSSLTIDMPYQIGTAIPATIAGTLLTQYQDPVTRTENITFHANSSIQNMMSFLVLDIGDRFTYQETVSGINEDYFINGVNFEIYGNNIIKFGYKTKQATLEVF